MISLGSSSNPIWEYRYCCVRMERIERTLFTGRAGKLFQTPRGRDLAQLEARDNGADEAHDYGMRKRPDTWSRGTARGQVVHGAQALEAILREGTAADRRIAGGRIV